MNINLHIEQLVLDGLPLMPGQGPAVQAALEAELSRLLAERGMGNLSGGAVPQLSVPSIQLSPAGPPAQWGRQIARTLYDGLAPAPAVSRPSPPTRPLAHPVTAPPHDFPRSSINPNH